jgi:polyisoprenoid-binding protein YceI
MSSGGRRARRRPSSPRIGVWVFALACVAAHPARAERRVLQIDTEASRVAIALGATLHTVRGAARIASGRIAFDEATGWADGRVVVDARSLTTGISARDAKLHAEVLDSERYPEIYFDVAGIEVLTRSPQEARIVLAGQLTIRGEAHEISLPAHVHLEGSRMHVVSHVVLPYVSWGLPDVSNFVLRVSDEVAVDLDVFGVLGD